MKLTLEKKLERLFADAELAVLQGRCRLDPDSYAKVVELERCCCVAGAAALTAGVDFDTMLDGDGDDGDVYPVLKARYGITEDMLDGLVDGFDNTDGSWRADSTRQSAEYAAARRMSRAFAVRLGVRGCGGVEK